MMAIGDVDIVGVDIVGIDMLCRCVVLPGLVSRSALYFVRVHLCWISMFLSFVSVNRAFPLLTYGLIDYLPGATTLQRLSSSNPIPKTT